MIKAVVLIKRKQGVSQEAFREHYEEVHAPLALKHLPMIRRYVRNHVMPMPGTQEQAFDCLTELWFDDLEDVLRLAAFVQSEEGRVIREDEEKFIDRDKTLFCLVDERVSVVDPK